MTAERKGRRSSPRRSSRREASGFTGAGSGFTCFDTPVGRCGVAWTPRGVIRFGLPLGSEAALEAHLRFAPGVVRPTRVPPVVEALVGRVEAHLAGQVDDFRNVPLDLDGIAPFRARVLESLREVGPGQTTTYAGLAGRVGSPRAARAVGQAMRTNPLPLLVPCHRVLASDGGLGGFMGRDGIGLKKRLLAIEGAAIPLPGSSRPASPRPARPRRAKGETPPAKALGERITGVAEPAAAWQATAGRPFDFAAAVLSLRQADPVLGAFIDRIGPLGLELNEVVSPFEAFLEAIVYQQLNGKAAAAIFGRVQAALGGGAGGAIRPFELVRATDEELRALGLSRPKIAAMRDLAEHALAGKIPTLARMRRMPDEAIIERLTRVRGIGRWTVEMFLIFRLGRPDVLAVDDYGLRKGFSLLYRHPTLPTPREFQAWGERWRPFRTAASWYLWRANEALAR
ncbi:MAG: methylated-DNA--[protein]-cysteine S-methyltransferase [Candidatus Riflebacteria bacterium]|nr:methylated-DNA--[protein]-cysteine S-methyltransferase [Candidatus Riflebacteria bacterium]